MTEAAVIARPDERWTERPLACVVLADGSAVTGGELRANLAARVPKWWLPDEFAFIAKVPKTSTGKFDKKRLRELLRAGEAGARRRGTLCGPPGKARAGNEGDVMKRSVAQLAAVLGVAVVISGAAIPANAAAGAAGGSGAPRSTALTPPAQDPFYMPPPSLASYPPGTVLRSRQVAVVGAMQPQTQAAYQMLYRTTNAIGRPAATVATVLIPASPAPGPRKLVSYQTFYDSLTLNCAPSFTMRGGNNGGSTQPLESQFIASELQQGWDVVVPDYEGPQSEWAAGPMLGRATLDGIRAVESFAPADLHGANTPVGMNGYSGGAIASTWAEALAPRYAPRLNIVAVAAGGLFPNLDYTISTLDGSIWYGVQIGVLVAINRAYPQLGLNHLLNAEGRTLAAQDGQDASGCADAATNEPGGNAAEFTIYPNSQALAAAPPVKNVLGKLTMETAAPVPAAPSFFYNAINDELAHIQPVDQLVAYYCGHGATIDYDRDLAGGSHVGGLAVYWPLALQYLENRLAGKPAPDNCP